MQSPEEYPSTPEQTSALSIQATEQFLEDFDRKYGSRYGDSGLEDLKTIAKEDLPRHLQEGNLGAAQSLLESDWSVSDKRLKLERCVALRELHIADKGEPTQGQLTRSVGDVRAALSDANRGKNVSIDKDNYTRVAQASEVIFSGRYDAESLEHTIDLFEEMILNESIIGGNPQRIESLRIVRDKQIERWANERAHTQAREKMIKDFIGIVGEDNPDFPREEIEGIVGPRWADGASLETVQDIIELAKGESDPKEREVLLRDLKNGVIPIEDKKAMEVWHAARRERYANQAEQERQRIVAEKREKMEALFARMTNGTPAVRESIFQDVEEDQGNENAQEAEQAKDKPPSPEVVAAREAVAAAAPLPKAEHALQDPESSSENEIVPSSNPLVRPIEIKVPNTSPAEGHLLNTAEQQEVTDKIDEIYKAANTILSNYIPGSVVNEVVTMISQVQSRETGTVVSAQELAQQLGRRLQGMELPNQVDPRPLVRVRQRIQKGDWPKPGSPIWTTRGTHSMAGRARLEARQDIQKLIEALLV